MSLVKYISKIYNQLYSQKIQIINQVENATTKERQVKDMSGSAAKTEQANVLQGAQEERSNIK